MLFAILICLTGTSLAGSEKTGGNSTASHIADIIRIYFSYRNIWDLNIYTCGERDGLILARFLIHWNYRVQIKSELTHSKEISQGRTGNFIDLSCEENFIFYEREVSSEVWLAYGGTDDEEEVEASNAGGYRLDSDVARCDKSGTLWYLTDKRAEAGLCTRPRLPWLRSRYDLGGAYLRGVFLGLSLRREYDRGRMPSQIMNTSFFPGREVDGRYTFSIWEVISTYYNFRIEIKETGTWGVRQPDGSFTGMIGLLISGQADFGLLSVQMREERFPVVSFLQPLHHLRNVFFFLEERILGTYKALVFPFSSVVWACVTALLLFSGVLFRLMTREESSEGIIYAIAIISQQGLPVSADSFPSKVLSINLLLTATMIYAMYNAAIMNGLLSPSPVTIRSVDDLKRSTCHLAIANTSHLNIPVNRKQYVPADLLSQIQSREGWLVETNAGLQSARRGRYCLFSEDSTLYPIINDVLSEGEKCSLRELTINKISLHPIMPKRSQYLEMFKQGVIKVLETGIADRLRKTWYPEKPLCLKTTVFVHVGLEAVSVAIICWLSGLIISFIIFVIEIRSYKRAQKFKKRKQDSY